MISISSSLTLHPIVTRALLASAKALLTCAAIGCAAPAAELDGAWDGGEPVAVTVQMNALTQNALTRNALTRNALTRNALTRNALTRNALTRNALTRNALSSDAESRQFMTYLVSCALPRNTTLAFDADDGTTYEFEGELGLSPEWGEPEGTCDETCQGWVSACLLARTNAFGIKVNISLRGRHPVLATQGKEVRQFRHQEGAFFGNLFLEQPEMYACLGKHMTDLLFERRACARPIGSGETECGFRFVGACGTAVAPSAASDLVESSRACSRERPRHGGFPDCQMAGSSHAQVLTVYLDDAVP